MHTISLDREKFGKIQNGSPWKLVETTTILHKKVYKRVNITLCHSKNCDELCSINVNRLNRDNKTYNSEFITR